MMTSALRAILGSLSRGEIRTFQYRTIASVCWLAAALALHGSVQDIQQALRDRQYEQALRLLGPELARRPGDARLWTLRGYALQGAGRAEEGLAAYRKALGLSPNYLPALQGAAQIEYASRLPEARQRLAAILRLDSSNQAAHAMLAVLAFEAGDCRSAVESFRKAGDALDHNKGGLQQFGACLYSLHRPLEAADVFRRLLALGGGDDIRYNLALALVEARRASDAIGVLQPLARRSVPEADVLTLLASADEGAGQTADAVASLRRAVELYPRLESVYVELAALYINHNAPSTAAAILDAAEKQVPPSARFAALRGLILVEMNQFDAAQSAFERARKMSPDAGFGATALGVGLLTSDQPEKSVELLREEWHKRPDRAETNFFLARALLVKGAAPGQPEFTEMIKLLERALALNPAMVEAHSALGKAYLALGREPDALRQFERAIALDPSDKTALYQLILLYTRTGRKNEAAALKQRMQTLLLSEQNPIRPAPPSH